MKYRLCMSLAILAQSLVSQSFDRYMALISKEFLTGNHYAAIIHLEKALEYKRETDSLRYLCAISCYNLNAWAKAEKYFKSLQKTDFETRHPEINYYLAQCLLGQGKYNEAKTHYLAYQADMSDDDERKTEIEYRLQTIQWASAQSKKKDPLIKIKRIENAVNTEASEFAPRYYHGSLYVSSQNYLEADKKAKPKKTISQVLRFTGDHYQPVPLDSQLAEPMQHMAHLSFSPDKKLAAFTICQYAEGSTELSCKIYLKKKLKEKWSPRISLPAPVNMPGYNSTHPFLSVDKPSGLMRLYFVSNRPHGKGGTDIYSVLLDDELSPSGETNHEEWNTPLNEYCPYYSADDDAMYFSSDGHPGFGSQDIFKYAFSGKDSLQIINMGNTINSSYDDLFFAKAENPRAAYFVSNRPGSTYLDQDLQACCFDVYKVNFIPATLDLSVYTFDQYDTSALANVKIELYDITDKDSLALVSELPNESSHLFKIKEDRKYRIVASKKNFIGDSVEFTTIKLSSLEGITKNVYLTEKKNLQAFTFEKTTNVVLKNVSVQLWNITDNILLDEFTNKDSNNFNFTLLKGRDYKLLAKKNKYEPAELIITAKETAAEPVLTRNLYLELAAISELRKLLPIKMFFDNDYPDPKSEADTTRFGFLEIYNDYLDRKGVYMYQYAHKLQGYQKTKAILEIDSFFEWNVRTGAEKLQLFMDKLHIILEEGHNIDIFIKGFASPRAKSEYNQRLSARRVSSIRNEFDRYRNGIFHDYIVNTQFKIKELPFGESMASSDVSDDLEDVRNSIYSLKAAYERRVEILEILKGVDENQ